MEERISSVEDTMKEIDLSVQKNVKSNKFLTQNTQEIWDTMKRPNLKTIGDKKENIRSKAQKIYSAKRPITIK